MQNLATRHQNNDIYDGLADSDVGFLKETVSSLIEEVSKINHTVQFLIQFFDSKCGKCYQPGMVKFLSKHFEFSLFKIPKHLVVNPIHWRCLRRLIETMQIIFSVLTYVYY